MTRPHPWPGDREVPTEMQSLGDLIKKSSCVNSDADEDISGLGDGDGDGDGDRDGDEDRDGDGDGVGDGERIPAYARKPIAMTRS